eukprot:Clim_evm24s152 gene=Clim_evmTU24s152
MIRNWWTILLSWLLVVQTGPAMGLIYHTTLDQNDSSLALLSSFGFVLGGHFNLTVESVEILPPLSPKTNPNDLIGFHIRKSGRDEGSYDSAQERNRCYLLAQNNVIHETQAPLDSIILLMDPITGKFSEPQKFGRLSNVDIILGEVEHSATMKISDAQQEGQFELMYINCGNMAQFETQKQLVARAHFTTLNMIIEEYNVINGHKHYLGVGEQWLPTALYLVFFVHIGLASVWIWVLYKNWSTGKVFKIHFIMLACVLAKAFSVLFHGLRYQSMDRYGHGKEAVDVMYSIFAIIKGTLLFGTILLVGAGMSFVKPFLSDRDKKVLYVVLPLQLVANIAAVVVAEVSPGTAIYITWEQIFIIFDLICCVSIMFPILWSIRHLKEGVQSSGKGVINLVKLKLFRQFYLAILVYLYFTRIVVRLLESTLPYHYIWLSTFAGELATVAFFLFCGSRFQPQAQNPYLKVPQNEEEEALFMQELAHIDRDAAELRTSWTAEEFSAEDGQVIGQNGTTLLSRGHED